LTQYAFQGYKTVKKSKYVKSDNLTSLFIVKNMLFL